MPSIWTLPTTASLCHSYMGPMPHAWVFRHSTHPFVPPLSPLDWTQVSVSPWGVLPLWVPPNPLCLWLLPPVWCSDYWHLVVLCVSIVWPFLRKCERPGILHSLSIACPVLIPPRATWTCWRCSIWKMIGCRQLYNGTAHTAHVLIKIFLT